MLVFHCSWPIPRNKSLNGWIIAIISIKQVLVLKMQEIVSHLLFLWNSYASIKSHFVSVIFLYLGHAGFQVFDWNKTRPNVASIYQRCRLEVNSLCIVIWKFHFPSSIPIVKNKWKISSLTANTDRTNQKHLMNLFFYKLSK